VSVITGLPEVSVESLNIDEQPELALLTARNAVEARLTYLARLIGGPDRPDEALRTLEDNGTIERPVARAIQAVLDASNPVAHGATVAPSVAASISFSAVTLVRSLDELIEATTRKIREMPASVRLSYAYLSLPARLRKAVADEIGIVPEGALPHEREYARAVFKTAKTEQRIADLWTAVSRHTGLIAADANPFKGAGNE